MLAEALFLVAATAVVAAFLIGRWWGWRDGYRWGRTVPFAVVRQLTTAGLEAAPDGAPVYPQADVATLFELAEDIRFHDRPAPVAFDIGFRAGYQIGASQAVASLDPINEIPA